MRRILTTVLTGGLILALATPATVAASTTDDRGPAGGTSPAATATRPADVAAPSILQSVDRAIVATMAAASTAQAQAPAPLTRKSKSTVRAQGGGGSTGMIIGLVSSLVGVAATVYMVKEMKKTTDAAQSPSRAR